MVRLAVIGLGHRASGMLKCLMRNDPEVRLSALADPDPQSARGWLKKRGIEAKNVRYHTSVDQLLECADRYDAVLIGTRCHLHTPIACQVAATGLPLFLEKPVAINRQQLTELTDAFRGRDDKVVVSFPLRVTPLFKTVRQIVQSGTLGTINQVQAVNNVGYGGVYFGTWYRNYEQTGGLWLQKATHDFDYLNHLIDAAPGMVAATATQRIYGGDKPRNLRCSACDQNSHCIESASIQSRTELDGGMLDVIDDQPDHACCFSESIGNQDAGSALLLYRNGLHVNYTQNFVTRRDAHSRGATIIGHRATLHFDWATHRIRVIHHHERRDENIHIEAHSGHGGGDDELARNFLALVRDGGISTAPLAAGLLSAQMCLAAREASEQHKFVAIHAPYDCQDVQLPAGVGG